MPEQIANILIWLLGEKAVPSFHSTFQMALRATIIFTVALVVVRIGHKRFFGRFSAFDLILTFILGSIFSRAINGRADFFETIVTSFLLVGLHWLLSIMAFRSRIWSDLLKGRPRGLIENGEIQWDAMKRSRITEGDLMEALRTHGNINDPSEAQLALLERSGDISVIKRSRKDREENKEENT